MTSAELLPVPMAQAATVLGRRPRVLIDLRSPAEFAQDHLHGALNRPLFDDLERAVIGTLYTRRSPDEAFDRARGMTLAKIAAYTDELARVAGWSTHGPDLAERVTRMTASGLAGLERGLAPLPAQPADDSVVLYCWRGGLRSRALIAFLRGLGHTEVLGIAGGYRAYRACVRARIAAWEAPPSFVLRGLTGVGKTLVLRALGELHPEWVLDLERMAGHRSSILGMVGLHPASQKLFESRLAERLERGFAGLCVVEGESRKVGDLILPQPVWNAVDRGIALELHTDRARRVQVLLDDYLTSEESRAQLAEQLPFLERRLGARWSGELVGRLRTGRESELVELLLEHYYAPLYRHSERDRAYTARFDSTDPHAAARDLARWIEARAEAIDAESRIPSAMDAENRTPSAMDAENRTPSATDAENRALSGRVEAGTTRGARSVAL